MGGTTKKKNRAAGSALDKSLLRAVILARIGAADGATRTELTRDIFPLAAAARSHATQSHVTPSHATPSPALSPAEWRNTLELQLGVLNADGLVAEKSGRIRSSAAGAAATAAFLGQKGKLRAPWPEIRNQRLVAKALGMDRESAQRIKALGNADRLRRSLVQKAFGLKIRGAASPAKLRAALAVIALERAFGNKITSGLRSDAALSAKAGRLLAGQLSTSPRDFGTDRRLIAALAAEYARAGKTDLNALQGAILSRFLAGQDFGTAPPASTGTPTKKRRPTARGRAGRDVSAAPPPAPAADVDATALAAVKPDLAGFALEVRQQARAKAKGWSGDRKAFISHVGQAIRNHRPEWDLSDIEYKCMLAEAHQAGHLLLAYADLKDATNIKDVKASAIAYKNSVWHYIRVEE